MKPPRRSARVAGNGRAALWPSDLPADLSAPAQRALAAAGIRRLKQLTRFREAEIKALHGIGPNALAKLQRSLSAKGLAFKPEPAAKTSA